jgi:hypothetical protein
VSLSLVVRGRPRFFGAVTLMWLWITNGRVVKVQ